MQKSSPPVLNIDQPKGLRPSRPNSSPTPEARSPKPAPRGKSLSTRFAAAVRWLHIYLSLLAFAAIMFFGVTGITLNHPTWFGGDAERIVEHRGNVDQTWVAVHPAEAENPDLAEQHVKKLELVEHLRTTHGVRGAISEFRIDDRECLILFKSPGYSADAIVDRTSGDYVVTTTMMGIVAMMNDLHKGRDSGESWSIVIDVVSILTVLVSVTGLILIFYLKRKRLSGTITALAGVAILVVIAVWLVP